MIVNIIEFILLKFDDINLVPKKLIEQLFTLQKLILALNLESLSSLINCSIQILNNICTEEQIIKGCYDVTPNGQKNLLRSLIDNNFCTDIENELIKQNNKFSKVFTLNYSSVNKMALGILIIYCCILGVIALLFFMLICVCVCQEKAACILLTCAPVILIVVICSGVADLVLFIIMLVNFYKGRTAGEFLDFYDECNYKNVCERRNFQNRKRNI